MRMKLFVAVMLFVLHKWVVHFPSRGSKIEYLIWTCIYYCINERGHTHPIDFFPLPQGFFCNLFSNASSFLLVLDSSFPKTIVSALCHRLAQFTLIYICAWEHSMLSVPITCLCILNVWILKLICFQSLLAF